LDGREEKSTWACFLFPKTITYFPSRAEAIKSNLPAHNAQFLFCGPSILCKTTMMRVMPAARVLAFARASPANRNVAFTALRMMSAAAPGPKVCVERRHILCNSLFILLKDIGKSGYFSHGGMLYSFW
jgi:hypothetical protein